MRRGNPRGVADLIEDRASPCRTDPVTPARRAQFAARRGWKCARGIRRVPARRRQVMDFGGDPVTARKLHYRVWRNRWAVWTEGAVANFDRPREASEYETGRNHERRTGATVGESPPDCNGHTAPKGTGRGNPTSGDGRRRPSSDRGANRRGGSEPRGRNVPGEANPGEADPAARAAGGARNPRRGSEDHRNDPDRR